METTTRTRTTPLAVRENGPLAVNTNSSSTAFFNRIQNNRALAIQLAVALVALIVVIAAVSVIYTYRSNAASSALAQEHAEKVRAESGSQLEEARAELARQTVLVEQLSRELASRAS